MWDVQLVVNVLLMMLLSTLKSRLTANLYPCKVVYHIIDNQWVGGLWQICTRCVRHCFKTLTGTVKMDNFG
jgi:hypothetical protein